MGFSYTARPIYLWQIHPVWDMWFKNLVVYRLPADWCWSASQLEDQLRSRQLRDCSAFEMFNRGWTSPFTSGDDQRLVRTVNQQHLIALGINQKLLPSSIIRQQAAELAKEQEKDQGFPVGRRQMREIKERVTNDLRARALVRRKVMHAWIDPVNSLFVVDSASIPRAEELVETLRDTLGSFAVTLLETERSPQQAMTAWLALGSAPLRFSIDQELEMQTADATKATVRYVRHPLETKDIKTHLSSGKVVMRLGLSWSDRISLVLTDKLQLKRVQFLDVKSDDGATEEGIDAGELFDAEFALMSGELGSLLNDVIEALGET